MLHPFWQCVIAQFMTRRRATRRRALTAARAAFGAILGGGAPIAANQIVHVEVNRAAPLSTPIAVALVVACLLFSGPTVYAWARDAFGSPVKAFGYTLLAEGVLTFARTPWLTLGALAVLVTINATATAMRLATPPVRRSAPVRRRRAPVSPA